MSDHKRFSGGGVRGAILSARLDSVAIPVDPDWGANNPVPNVGYRKPIKAEQIEEWGEQEFADRTVGTWGDAPECRICHERIAENGSCACGTLTEVSRIMHLCLGTPLVEIDEMPLPKVSEVEKTERPEHWPTAANLPDLPEDASPEEVSAWRDAYRVIQQRRQEMLANTYDGFAARWKRD